MKYVIILLFITQAQSVNNSVITNAKMANALKSFNTLYTGNLVNGFKYELSSSQKSVLAGLAQQCPYEYGPAVFQARAYLKACGDSVNYFNVCENMTPVTSNARLLNSNDNALEQLPFSIYPNPAMDKVTISASIPTGAKGEVNIYNNFGNKLFTVILNEGENNVDIDLSKVAAGIYFYKAFVNNKMVKADKLVIIK